MDAVAASDDAKLLRLYAAKGDAAAFAELVRRYADMVYATARRVTGNASTAEDVAQDCFLRLAQGSSAISGSLAAWLHRTSLNRSLELLRSERARQRREAQIAANSVASSDAADVEAAELVSHVDQGLAALPDELRAVVTEHFLCGKSQSDIAASLKLSQPTVSRRIDKGLSELRRWLKDRGWSTVAGAALPLVFSNAVKVAAPSPLRMSLVKIGLSGVRGSGAVKWPWLTRPAALISIATVAMIAIGVGAWFAMSPPRSQHFVLPQIPAAAGRTSPSLPAAAASPIEPAEHEDSDVELQSIVPQIPVTNLVVSKQFYQQLGFHAGDHDILERDDLQLSLVVKSPPFEGPVSLRIGVKNTSGLQRELSKAGVPVQSSPDGQLDAHHFAVSDPDGNRIVFFEDAKKDQH